jgi:hypothetical protein
LRSIAAFCGAAGAVTGVEISFLIAPDHALLPSVMRTLDHVVAVAVGTCA